MSQPSFQTLGTVQKTMVIPLFARAKESLRNDPIIRDMRAQEILDQIQYDTQTLEKESALIQVVACVAAKIFDAWTIEFLEQHPDGTIVEIGSGLDTRYERIDNGRAQWFDIDLPDSIAVRRQYFKETPRRRMIAASVLDPEWVEIIKESNPSAVMFLAEGVLFYLSEGNVKQIYKTIADNFPGSIFAHDSCIRGVADNSTKLAMCRMANTRFQWGIDDIREVESWDSRYKVLKVDTVLNHCRSRYPWPVRLATWFLPSLRNVFTTNLVQIG